MSDSSAFAITRERTLLLDSTSPALPPMKSKLNLFFITAWSPPRESAISTAREANCSASLTLSAFLPMPMDSVACIPLGLTT